MEVGLEGLLMAETQRKVMFRTGFRCGAAQELDDFNVTYIFISSEHLKFMVDILNESNRQMCPSRQEANWFLFAISV